METVQYRREYVVERHIGAQPPETFRFHELDEARMAVAIALDARVTTNEEFGGRIAWYVDETVPLTFFDEKVTEYADSIHGWSTVDDMPIDRDERYLLVERNREGGYWLTTGNMVDRLVNECEAISGEYPDDWEIHEVWDLEERRELNVNVTAVIID